MRSWKNAVTSPKRQPSHSQPGGPGVTSLGDGGPGKVLVGGVLSFKVKGRIEFSLSALPVSVLPPGLLSG